MRCQEIKILGNCLLKADRILNCNILLLWQNVFPKGPEMRNLSINAQHIVVFQEYTKGKSIHGSQIVGNGQNIVETSSRNSEEQKPQQQTIVIAQKKRGKVRKKTSSNNYKRREGKRIIYSILKSMSKKQLSAIISHRK